MRVMILKTALILTLLTSALIGGLHAAPNDDDLRALIVPSGCLCWQGIEVGVTTRAEATRILEAHPWVQQVFQSSIGVSWRWNGKQPAAYNGTKDGLLQISGNLVSQLRIQTLIPFGDIWLTLGHPDDALLVRPLTRSGAYQIARYDTGAQFISTIGCPVSPQVFWSATVTLGMGNIWTTEALNSREFDIYHSARWWRRLRAC